MVELLCQVRVAGGHGRGHGQGRHLLGGYSTHPGDGLGPGEATGEGRVFCGVDGDHVDDGLLPA